MRSTDPRLAALDCRAATGDAGAARLARWLDRHPDGPQSAEDAVEETALPRTA